MMVFIIIIIPANIPREINKEYKAKINTQKF